MDSARQLRIEHLENLLSDRGEDYRGVSQKLREEQDIPAKGILKRQLASIEKEIKKIEAELNPLKSGQDAETQSQAIEELIDLLNQFVDERESIERSYLLTLKKRYQSETSLPTAIKTAIAKLASYNCIPEFVARIVIYVSNPVFIQSLHTWGQSYEETWEDILVTVRQAEDERKKNERPAILFTVSISDVDTTQSENEEVYYRYKAWLIADLDRYRTTGRGFIPLGEKGQTGNETYTLQSLGDRLSDCVREAQCQLIDKEPMVQVFLPKTLLSESIDLTWNLCSQGGRGRPIGREVDLVVRCSDRLNRSYEGGPRWRSRWQYHPQLTQKLVLDVFTSGNDIDLDELYYNLTDDAAKQFIGLKVTQSPKPLQGYCLADVLLEAGIPLAIWSRQDIEDCCALIEDILTDCLIFELPGQVRQSRRSGRRDASHIGNHLTLLWDDPELLPPITA